MTDQSVINDHMTSKPTKACARVRPARPGSAARLQLRRRHHARVSNSRHARGGAACRRSSRRRWRSSSRAASPRRGSTTLPSAPASPRARSTCTSRTRNRCSRSLSASSSCRWWTRLNALPPPAGTVRELIETFASKFLKEVIGTRRGDLVRLIVAEGPRFPSVADFYYREVVSRGIAEHARADRARHRPWRDPRKEPRALSADPGRARDDRGDLAEPVCDGTRRSTRRRCCACISI